MDRDSSLLDESNWDYIIKQFKESDTIRIIRESHWAVGWVEWLGINQSNKKALIKADDIMARLENYPLLDEEDFYRRETEAVESIWKNASLKEKIYYCNQARVNIFKARSACFPYEADDSRALFDYVRPD